MFIVMVISAEVDPFEFAEASYYELPEQEFDKLVEFDGKSVHDLDETAFNTYWNNGRNINLRTFGTLQELLAAVKAHDGDVKTITVQYYTGG